MDMRRPSRPHRWLLVVHFYDAFIVTQNHLRLYLASIYKCF